MIIPSPWPRDHTEEWAGRVLKTVSGGCLWGYRGSVAHINLKEVIRKCTRLLKAQAIPNHRMWKTWSQSPRLIDVVIGNS